MKKILLMLILFVLDGNSFAQRCEIISMSHIGGNATDQVSSSGILLMADGHFAVPVNHVSTSGDLKFDCNLAPGNFIFLNYDSNFSLLSQTCAPKGVGFQLASQHVFTQANGDVILVGMRNVTGSSHDIGIERRNASGNVLWTKFYGGSGSDGLGNVVEAEDGGFFISVGTNSDDGDVGMHYGSSFDADIWILRLDNNGDKLWAKLLGGTGADLPCDIRLGSNGSSYVFGVTTSNDHEATGNHGGSDLYVVKLDSLGEKVWHRCFGGSGDDGSGYDLGIKAIPDGSGGFYVLNRTSSQDGDVQARMPDDTDFWLLSIDSVGNIIWENTYGASSNQYPSAICQAVDGTLWVAGVLDGGTTPSGHVDVVYGNNDPWVVHVDTSGNFINQRVLGSERPEEVQAIMPLADETVVVFGVYRSNTSNQRSPDFPRNASGDTDLFMARLGPQPVGIDDPEIKDFAWEIFPNPARKYLEVKTKTDEI
ncbi:MAG: hypothetical protein EOP49_24885, partial [Sphingobacteriales bacterium]